MPAADDASAGQGDGVSAADCGTQQKRKKDKLRALVGVRALWVAQVHRDRGRACPAVVAALLDAARADSGALSGLLPRRAEVAWASWVSDVSDLAADYCGGARSIIRYA